MDRRRVSKRPASTEEIECWEHACASLSALSSLSLNATLPETINRVNRLISAWPTDDTLPSDGIIGVKDIHKKLASGLSDIKANSERDVKALDEAIESLSVLIGLRRASESAPAETIKRTKRPRGSSPAVRANTPSTPRGSVGPQGSSAHSRDSKARRDGQLPLQTGRMVAFHPPPTGKPNGASESGDADDTTWILAKVVRNINGDKNRYEVQDIEPQEDGNPGQCYKTTLRHIIPLPDPNAPSTSPAYINAYPEYSAGSTVLALYPDTSCFYRAQVIASPRDTPHGRNPATKSGSTYKLKFDDDDDQEHTVSAQFVVEWPEL